MACAPMLAGAVEKAIDPGPSPAVKASSPDTLVLEEDEAGVGHCANLLDTKCNGVRRCDTCLDPKSVDHKHNGY